MRQGRAKFIKARGTLKSSNIGRICGSNRRSIINNSDLALAGRVHMWRSVRLYRGVRQAFFVAGRAGIIGTKGLR
jgi:hypothetical protein